MKFVKRCVIMLVIIMAVSLVNSSALWAATLDGQVTNPPKATGSGSTDLQSMESAASSFISAGSGQANNFDTSGITKNFSGLGSILTMVGAGVMVAVVTYMGIKYMISPPDKQAALKQQLVGVVAAGIVIFGAYAIWKAVIGVVSKF